MPARIWDQVIGVFPPYLSLTLIHPDGRGHTHWTDIEFLEEVESRNWCESNGYAASGGTKERRMYLHWLPLGKPPEGMDTDHLDKDKRNSCRDNLMIKPKRGNHHNMKNHGEWGPGISYKPTRQSPWIVCIRSKNGRVYSPIFRSPEQAMFCRDLYLNIYRSYDKGERDLPTREELKTIADQIRQGE